LAVGESSPDFAEVLQAFLADATVKNGYYDLPLVVHSDTIACLDLEVEIEFVKEQTVLPEGVGETTLSFTHNGLPEAEADLLQIEVPAGARINAEKTTALVTGAFQPSRVVFGPTGAVAEPAAIPVTSVQSQAQPIRLEKTLAATAVDLRLALDPDSATAIVSLNIQADSDGKPADETLLSEPVTISLDRDTAVTPTWISADLPSEFQFNEGERYWLVLQAADGSVLWSADEAGKDEEGKDVVGMQYTDNGGLSWRLTSSPDLSGAAAGLFRLRYTPDRFQMPIELQVGSGDREARVSLDRFQPLGRVEFDLGFDEIADTINRFLEEESAATCPVGEHLANGDLEKWTTTGDGIPQRNPQQIDLPPQLLFLALAIAPDGQRALTIQLGEDSTARVLSIDIPSHKVDEAIELSTLSITEPAAVTSLTVNTDGTRAYVLLGQVNSSSGSEEISWSLFIVDMTANETIGDFPLPEAKLSDLLFSDIAVTPGGDRLYITIAGSVEAIDTDKLEQAVLDNTGTATLETVRVDGLEPIQIAYSWPTSLAISPDGARLYVAALNAQGLVIVHDSNAQNLIEGTLQVFDIQGHKELEGSPVPTGEISINISLSPDGKRLLMPNLVAATVSVIDAMRLALVSTIQLPDPSDLDEESSFGGFLPGTTIFSPDGCLAFVASLASSSMAIIDPNRPALVNVIKAGNEGDHIINLGITPGGDRLYALLSDDEMMAIRLVNWFIGIQLPDEWLLTSGSVARQCYIDPFQQAAILGINPVTRVPDTRQSSFSQVVPVVDSCTYDFSFWGKAAAYGAVAELLWLGEACGLLRTDQVPIEEVEGKQESAEQIPIEIALHRRRLIAPEGATQAEIRFITPAGIVAAIDKVSLLGTREMVSNSDLQEIEEGQLAGWSQSPAPGAGVIVIVAEEGVELQNLSTVPINLIQTITVPTDQPFKLAFHGKLANQPGATGTARLEINWLAGDGTAVDPKTTVEIPADGPDRHAAAGTVPTKASEAEIHLVIPGGASLIVEEVSFKPVELIQVPLTFIAQTPGELKVSDIRVAFDEASPTLPSIPESGLCTPTPPDRQPGEGGDCCYCPCCGGDDPVLDPQPMTTATGRPAISGSCPNCSTRLVQPGGPVSAARIATQPVITRRLASRVSRTPARPRAARLRVAPQPPPAMTVEDLLAAISPMRSFDWGILDRSASDPLFPPLTAIDGIGPARAVHLATIGIEDMGMLAEADPDDVAEVLKGVTAATADAMIAEAQELMAMHEDE
jgi:DNA-binding beta-propeller fold protein YncE